MLTVLSVRASRFGEGVGEKVRCGVGGRDGAATVHIREQIVHVIEEHLQRNNHNRKYWQHEARTCLAHCMMCPGFVADARVRRQVMHVCPGTASETEARCFVDSRVATGMKMETAALGGTVSTKIDSELEGRLVKTKGVNLRRLSGGPLRTGAERTRARADAVA